VSALQSTGRETLVAPQGDGASLYTERWLPAGRAIVVLRDTGDPQAFHSAREHRLLTLLIRRTAAPATP
jgi:hypothetical protein